MHPVPRPRRPPAPRLRLSRRPVFVGWAGGCAFGPALVGATLTLQTGFTGTRTGDFDPPPYTPAEVVVPDGGFDAETSVDAGP